MKEFTLAPLKNSLASLRAALAADFNEYTRDSAIKRFDLAYELCWKTLRRFLAEFSGMREDMVRNVYRAAGETGLLKNGEVEQWFAHHENRSRTAYIYEEAEAERVYAGLEDFAADAEKLLARMEASLRKQQCN